jgi:hypothetical protein
MRFVAVWSLLCVLAIACRAAEGDPFKLAFRDSIGAKRTYATKYSITGTIEGAGLVTPLNASVTYDGTESVLASAQGQTSLAYEVRAGMMSVQLTLEGKPQTFKQPLEGWLLEYSRTPKGAVSNLKITGALARLLGGPIDMVSNQLQYPGQMVQFPDRELAIGESWTTTQSVEVSEGQRIEVTCKHTLAAARKIDGKELVQINSDVQAKADKLPVAIPLADGATSALTLAGRTVTLFDPHLGEINKTTFSGTASMSMTLGAGLKSTSTLTLTGTTTKSVPAATPAPGGETLAPLF